MSEKKQLNEEQLEKVSGGNYEKQCVGDLNNYSDYHNYVNVDDAIIGEKYLFFQSDISWLYGTLLNRYGIYKILDIQVEDGFGNFNRGPSFSLEPTGSSNLIVSDYGTIEIRGTQCDILSNK